MQSRYVKKLLGNKVLLILVGFLAILFCIARHAAPTSAETLTFQVDNTTPILEVTVPSNVYLNLAPTSGAAFGVADLAIGVGTNNPTGYTLSMNVDANNSALVNDDVTITPADYPGITVDSSNHPTIETLAQSVDGYTQDTFPVNKWGIRIGTSGNFFRAVFATAPVLSQTSAASNSTGSEAVVQLAAKVDSSQPIGAYHTTINFIAVTNPLPKVYMQSMVLSDCHTFPTVVYDSRDEQPYKVAKLADGQCWMTSNLNLAGGTKLDSAGSNVPAGYTQSDPYYTLPASTAISSGTSVPSDQFSSDSGQYVFNTNNNTDTCNSSTPCNSYYSWLVATAGGKDSSGNAVTTDGYNTAYSICPKGWRLPTSTTSNARATIDNNWKTGDWYALAIAYGANLESNYYQRAATFYNNAGPGTTPNFLLAGRYTSGSFDYSGSYGYYWSATSSFSTYAYYLNFNSSYVNSANSTLRRRGFSVRCVFGS